MDYDFYLDRFERAAARLDKKILHKKDLEVSTGVVMDSVFLKLYKNVWSNMGEDPIKAKTRIFFSVWINDKTIAEGKLFYNIHAFKLRQLKGYSITSRDFAEHFRKQFKKCQRNWENVSVDFGPLTLMEGWMELDIEKLENIIVSLAHNFATIDHLIEDTLKIFKHNSRK